MKKSDKPCNCWNGYSIFMVVSDFGSYTYIPTIPMEDRGLRQVEWDFLKYYCYIFEKNSNFCMYRQMSFAKYWKIISYTMPQIWQYNTYAEYYSISRALCCAKGQKMGQKLIQVFFISRSSIYSYLVV